MIRVRTHGAFGPVVIVLHGGPAAAGSAAPIAKGLAGDFQVLEPWQRGSGEDTLSVATHVADLHELIQAHDKPALVGESWGAMLALAYAAEHPEAIGSLALIGCGSFDPEIRERMKTILFERMDPEMRERLRTLKEERSDPDKAMSEEYHLMKSLYSFEPFDDRLADPEVAEVGFDARAHRETWDDEMRLQADGIHPAVFASITVPTLMIHGAYDPHPGDLIRDNLLPHIPHLEYVELDECGHSPWEERLAKERFFEILLGWLRSHTDWQPRDEPDPPPVEPPADPKPADPEPADPLIGAAFGAPD